MPRNGGTIARFLGEVCGYFTRAAKIGGGFTNTS
jgi:hypothetical protein